MLSVGMMELNFIFISTAIIGLVLAFILKNLKKISSPAAAAAAAGHAESADGDVTASGGGGGGSHGWRRGGRRKGGASLRKAGGSGGGAGGGGGGAQRYSHEWLACSLRGHGGSVLDAQFSSDAKYLITSADDSSLLVWKTRKLVTPSTWTSSNAAAATTSATGKKDVRRMPAEVPPNCRINLDLDNASRLCWSPDNKALLVARHADMCLQVLRLGRRDDGFLSIAQLPLTFPCESDNIIGAGVASSGKYVMSCTGAGRLTLYDLRASVLATADTLQVTNYWAGISPCAKYVVTAGFTSDVKVWCVQFAKDGTTFDRLQQAFVLAGGHTAGVLSVDVSVDSCRMATASRDGTWALYNTDIEYKLGQSASVLCSARFADAHTPHPAPAAAAPPAGDTGNRSVCVALAPDGATVLVADHNSVQFYSARDGARLAALPLLFTGEISRVLFDPSSRLALVAGDRQVHVLHNVPGQRVLAQELKQKLARCENTSMKERLKSQLVEVKKFLAVFE